MFRLATPAGQTSSRAVAAIAQKTKLQKGSSQSRVHLQTRMAKARRHPKQCALQGSRPSIFAPDQRCSSISQPLPLPTYLPCQCLHLPHRAGTATSPWSPHRARAIALTPTRSPATARLGSAVRDNSPDYGDVQEKDVARPVGALRLPGAPPSLALVCL
jgi:hypothetical protein